MAKTIANVLTGVATLSVRQPNDAIAEWTSEDRHQGTYSVKLKKTGTGDYGSTHIKFKPPGINLGTWNTQVQIADQYVFWYLEQAMATIGNWVQAEFRFDDPNSNAHAEVTVYPFHSIVGSGIWEEFDFGDNPATTPAAYYGANELGTAVNGWGLGLMVDTVRDHIGNNCSVGAAVDAADDWVLSWVKFELWESTPARYALIDEITIHGVAYTVEPGSDMPGLELGSPFTEVGYTEDGVNLTYTADETDVEVEEETFPIDRVITKESLEVTCNMAESSLYNIDKAMAGSVLSGSIIKLGGGVNKTMNLKIEGINPAGFKRAIHIPLATATGAVGMSYKKGTKTIIPVTFRALKGDSDACVIVDNIA